MADKQTADNETGASTTDEETIETTTASASYKVLGKFDNSSGAGVQGRNTADSGTPIGVEGRVPNSTNGYGLSTPDDANVGGTLEATTAKLSALAGAVTGNVQLTSLVGDGLTVAGDALALGPTSVQTDTASTFAESNVTVTHSNTTVTDNAIQLVTDTDSATRPSDNNNTQFSDIEGGLEFEPQVNLSEITATISSNSSGESTVYIYELDGTLVTSESSPGSGNSVTLTASLSAKTKYYITTGTEDNSQYTSGYYDTPSFPYTSGTVDITDGTVLDTGTFYDVSNAHSFSSLEATGPTTSGAATVEFSQPSSVRRWESATFQDDQDGQDVEVYVETSSDNGSTWSDWQSKPIGSGTDLSAIPPGDYVRFRVEIARADKTYEPRLTLLSRQYSP